MAYESDLLGDAEMDGGTVVWAIFAEEAERITRAYCNAIVTGDATGVAVDGESITVSIGTDTTVEVDAEDCHSLKQDALDWGEPGLVSAVFGSVETESGAEDFPD